MRGHTWFQQEVCYRVLRGIPTPQSDFKIASRSGCKSKEEGSKTRYYEGASVRLNDTHVLICVCMYVCVYIWDSVCVCVCVFEYASMYTCRIELWLFARVTERRKTWSYHLNEEELNSNVYCTANYSSNLKVVLVRANLNLSIRIGRVRLTASGKYLWYQQSTRLRRATKRWDR